MKSRPAAGIGSEPRPDKKQLFAGVASREVFRKDSSVILKPCALCGGSTGRRLYMQAHFPVVRCACGLVYADEHFEDADLKAFYSGDYYQRAYVCHPPEIDKKIADDYVRAFRMVDRLQRGGRLLDFGSARGTFLQELVARGFAERWQVEGLDINPDEVAMARTAGIRTTSGTLDEAAFPPGSFDAVTSFSVIEHLQDPLAEMRKIGLALRPGGHLLAIVPAGDCLIIRAALLAARLLGDRVRGFTDNVFHEEHLYYFTRSTWRRALQACGFEVVRFFGQPSYLETHPPGLVVTLVATGLRIASWSLRMQTMLGVVARKV